MPKVIMQRIQSMLIMIIVLCSVACCLMYVYVYINSNSKSHDYIKSSYSREDIFAKNISTRSPKVMDDQEKVLAAARRITSHGKTLLVSFINNAYLPFAYSWLCNTEGMGIHNQVLIIVNDKETEEDLRKNRPEIETVSISGFKMSEDQQYTRAGYVRIGIRRTIVLNWILQGNSSIFLFEFDCLWVKNPVPEMTKYVDQDLIITPVANRPGLVAIGFYYMVPTERMKKLWEELTRRLIVLDSRLQKLAPGTVISESENDQLYLSELVRKKYANIRVKLLDLKDYPDGKWYDLPAPKKAKISKIYILNNNWVIGNKHKIARAKQWGHWFLKDDNTCDAEKVTSIVKLT